MKLFEEIKGENCIFKCDEEIKGGHSANELVRSPSESETVESAVEKKIVRL